MKLPHISLEQARKLKHLGFDWGVNGSYTEYITSQKDSEHGYSGSFGWEKGEVNFSSDYFINNHKSVDYSSPSYMMYACPVLPLAIKWLYFTHGLYVELDRWSDDNASENLYFVFSIYDNGGKRLESNDFRYPQLDGAESAGLDWCLNYLMEKQNS